MRVLLRSITCFSFCCCALLLSGCSNNFDPTQGETLSTSTVTMQGEVFGGFFPVSGARVFLFSPGTSGVGGASTSLISASTAGSAVDSTSGSITNGARYVLTDSKGGFTFTSTCTPGRYVYLYASGGVATTGGANNPQIGLMSVVGECPGTDTVDATPYVRITENTTVAAAYALAGFATDPGHISYTGTALGLVGLGNAFGTATNLFNQLVPVNSTSSVNGFPAATTTVNSTGTIPQTLLNTLSNILVACVNSGNSASATTTGCNNLRKNATSDGAVGTGPTAPATGSFSADAPADTATAMINIAHHPFANLTSLFNLQGTGAGQVYKPALGAAPTSFVVEVEYTGGGVQAHTTDAVNKSIGIDGLGNVWANNYLYSNVSKFSPLGVPLSPSTGFTSSMTNCILTGTFDGSTKLNTSIALDLSGNAWIGFTSQGDSVCELSPTGSVIFALQTGPTPDASMPQIGIADIAFDATGNAWLVDGSANSDTGALLEVSGTTHTLLTTKSGNSLDFPVALAIDAPSSNAGHTGDIWVANYNGVPDSVFTSTGANASFSPASAGSISEPVSTVIDSNGYVWNLSFDTSSNQSYLSKTSATGTSGTTYTYASLDGGITMAMDGAGSVWVASLNPSTNMDNVITEVSNSGALLTPAAGYTPLGATASNGLFPFGIAIDGSGNLWYQISNEATLRELVGAAVPVATPLAYGTANNKLGSRP